MEHPLTWLPLAVGIAACGGAPQTSPNPSTYELQPVVGPRLAQLEQETSPPSPPQELEESRIEDLEGLLQMASGTDPQYASLAQDAVSVDFGPPAIPHLGRVMLDSTRPWEARSAAAGLLAALDDHRAIQMLLETLEVAPEAWLRRHAAYHLSRNQGDGAIPKLLKRLKYEQDPETFAWLAASLAVRHNYSGLEALIGLGQAGATDELRGLAQAQLGQIEEATGLTADELNRRWGSAEASSLKRPAPSSSLKLEAWRLVESMGDDTIQLRGVDDARFVLCRLGPWAAIELASALCDEDFHIRLHTAQVLERMGPRAWAAGPALLAALSEPLLAPSAAEALGRIGHPPARPALEQGVGSQAPHELRVASVRALGRLGLPDSLPVVRALFANDKEPKDLRMASATALVLLSQGDEVAPWLIAQLGAGSGQGPAAEIALHTWLSQGDARGRSGFKHALEAWESVQAAPPGVTPSLEGLQDRRTRRQAALDVRALTQR